MRKSSASYCSIWMSAVTLLFAYAALADDLTWTGSVSGHWNNPSNWIPSLVPGASDHVIINSGDVTLPGDAAFAVLDWGGGVLRGSVTVASNSVLNIEGDERLLLYGPLVNSGLVRVRGRRELEICGACGGFVENQPGGLIDLQSDQDWTGRISWPPLPVLRNAGTVRKSGGTGTSRIAIPLEGTGTVEALTGNIELYGDGAPLMGHYTAASGAAVTFLGLFTLVSGPPSTSGAGEVLFSSDSSVRFSGPITNFSLSAGNLVGPAVVTGTLNWNGGYLRDPLTVASSGVLNIDGNAYRYTYDGRITNAGLVQVRGAGRLDLGTGPFHNLVGGVVDLQDDQDWLGRGATLFRNEGILRKSGGNGTNRLGLIRNAADNLMIFENTGSVEALSGTIHFGGAYSQSSSARMATALRGPTPGTGYGRFKFSSPPELAGTFAVETPSHFRPQPGDQFSVMGFPSLNSDFACYRGVDLGGGLWLQPVLGRKGLTLAATSYVTNALPQLFIARSPAGARVMWPLGFPGWTLESATNLTQPVWLPVGATCDSQAVVPLSEPEEFYRLRSQIQP
jgi:hypothetical protein